MAINWSQVQALCEPTLAAHWVRCRDALALDCPVEVFDELFFEHHGDEAFGATIRAVDWQGAVWREVDSGGSRRAPRPCEEDRRVQDGSRGGHGVR